MVRPRWPPAPRRDRRGRIDVYKRQDGCIENTAPYFALGPVYTVRSPHIGGAPDVANSLYALQKAVFEEKRLSLRDIDVYKRQTSPPAALR